MNDTTRSQEDAILHAVGLAAEYLHECGTTDLAALTPEQALEFAKILIFRYQEQDWIPF